MATQIQLQNLQKNINLFHLRLLRKMMMMMILQIAITLALILTTVVMKKM